jgi:putative flavoprotein involved in K+ transport
VFLACGRAPWAPRRVGDHNLIWWAVESGFYDAPFSSLPPTAAARGIAPPSIAEPHPFDADAPVQLDLSDFGAVIFASGFRPDYESWVRFPGAFDEFGFPIQCDGASTLVRGLYFIGVHFLRKRKSSLLIGVGEDAAIVARQITAETAPVAT